MDDQWENANNLSPTNKTDAAIDTDGDGMSNYEEFRAGTEPTNANSRLWIYFRSYNETTSSNKTMLDTGEKAQVIWPSITNRTYSLWRASELGASWSNFVCIKSRIPGGALWSFFQDPTATNSDHYYYRIQVE
jgi:hypothetical protein